MCHKTSKSESTVLKFIELCFYRAMPRRARLCHRMSSVCPSVCLSVHPPVCDDQVCFFHTGWNNSKIISRLISLRFLLGLTSTWAIWCNGNTHKHRGCVMSTKTALSPKRCKIGPRLLWQTNKKSHACFRLVPAPKSMTLDDLERPKAETHSCGKKSFYGANQKNLNGHHPKKCRPMILVSRNIRYMRIFAGVPWSVKRQWGCRRRRF